MQAEIQDAIISFPLILTQEGDVDMKQGGAADLEAAWPKGCFSGEIADFRRGEPEALIRIFKTLEPDLNRYYWYCFGKVELVEEAMQEFYQLMVTRLLDPKYRNINISLYKILRKDAARRIHRFINRYPVYSLDDPDFKPGLDKPGDDVDPLMRIRLMECIDELNLRQRRIIRFHFFDGMPMTDVPQAMEDFGNNVSYANVRKIVERALKLLKICLEGRGDGND